MIVLFNAPPSKTFSLEVQAEGIRFIYANLFGALPGLIVLPIVISWSVWDKVQHTVVVCWFLFAFASIPFRSFLAYQFHLNKPSDKNVFKWGRYFTYTSFYQGIVYGTALFVLFIPDSLPSQLLLLGIIISMVAGSYYVYSYWIECFYALVIPLLTLTSIALALRPEEGYMLLSISILAYLWLSIALVRRSRESVLSSIQLRFENAELLEDLKVSKENAEQANARKTHFLASASHDLRQPVQALNLFTDALVQETKTEKGQRLLGFLKESVEALGQLLSSLLDISKLDAGIVKPDMSSVHLSTIIERQYRHFLPLAQDKGLKLSVKSCQSLWVTSDKSLLENILQNLISNAIKYTDHGGVLVSCRSRSDKVLIEVWDTGRGISEHEQERVLDEFYQVDNKQRERSQGLGLGLAIVKRHAHLLDHSFSLISELGKGTHVKLLVKQAQAPEKIADDHQLENLKHLHLDEKILVIDDDRLILEGMKTLLEGWGHQVMLASGLPEALDIAQNQNIDVIISDYSLAGEDGIQTISEIRQLLNYNIPAFLITGDTAPERIKKAKESGLILLHKPVNPAKLRAALQLELSR